MSANDRSVSRGREYQSSGRGGAGNIRRSASRDPQSPSAPNRIPGDEDAINAARGREMPFQAVHHQGVGATGDHMMTHMGRGGAGNVRSPSRDVGAGRGNPIPEEEREIIEKHDSAPKIVSTGRGGMGNMADRSRSRGPNSSIDYSHSPSRTSFSPSLSTGAHTGAGVGVIPPSPTYDRRSQSRGREVHSSGRGGVGNITRLGEDQASLERVEENERKVFMHSGDVHSTGRGGIANLTHVHSPPPEGAHPHAITPAYLNEFVSSGRGGAGNIRSRSASRDPVNGSVNSDHHGHGHGHGHAHGHSGLNKLLGKMGIGEKETTVEG